MLTASAPDTRACDPIAATRSFFGEQDRHRWRTWLFVALGVVWIVVLGMGVTVANIGMYSSIVASGGSAPPVRVSGWALASAGGAATVLWALVVLGLYLGARRLIPRLLGARHASASDHLALDPAISSVALASGHSGAEPDLWVLETGAANAFACGSSVSRGSILVTRGLVETLGPEELQAVIAHEFAHLKNGDAAIVAQAVGFVWIVAGLVVVASAVVGVALAAIAVFVAIMAKVGEQLADDDGWSGCAVLLGAVAVALVGVIYVAAYAVAVGVMIGLGALGIKAAASSISQAREYLADACSAQWTRNPVALASALAKVAGGPTLEGAGGRLTEPLWFATGSGLEDGFTAKLFAFLLHTHPPVAQRIERLKEMAGSTAVTEGEWLDAIHGRGWDHVKEWLVPVAATILAVVVGGGLVALAVDDGRGA